VISCCPPEEDPELLISTGWAKLSGELLINESQSDIAVFKIQTDLDFARLPLDCLSSESLAVNQEVYILGFPKSRPLISNGVINRDAMTVTAQYSGFTQLQAHPNEEWPSGERVLWFKGFSEPGLSGSPVFFRHRDSPSEIRVAAVLAGDGNCFDNGPLEIRAFDVEYAVESIRKDVGIIERHS
jgi:hypothetical protein